MIRRRTFLGAAGAAFAAACAPNASSTRDTAAPSLGQLETTTIRIADTPACDPWYWLAEPYLREEGFTDIQTGAGGLEEATADLGVFYGNTLAAAVDTGVPIIALAGTHTGCIELWGRPGINSPADLRGKTIAINRVTFSVAGTTGRTATDFAYGFFVSLLSYVGLQIADVNFVEIGAAENIVSYFVAGKADAIATGGLNGPLLHANKDNPGHVILDAGADKPWGQNYCCLLTANRDWATAHPVAVKRATRAILRSIDACKRDRRATAKAAIDKGTFKTNPAVTEQVVYDVIKDQSFEWRDYDPEDTVRFFTLRLTDAKLIKKTPSQIIADGTDFAYFRQLQKELKG